MATTPTDSRERLIVIILTLNEERNLAKAIASVEGRLPILVVDSGSTDATEAIARGRGAEFVLHPFENYSAQRNFALERVADRYEWAFFLDADEELTPPLIEDILRATEDEALDGAYVRLDLRVLGHRLVNGEYKDAAVLRLMRPQSARFARGINERVDDRDMRVVTLATRLIHRDAKPLADLFRKHITYAQREAEAYLAARGQHGPPANTLAGASLRTKAGRTAVMRWVYDRVPLFVRPFLHHGRTVIAKGAWRDGLPGLMHAAMHTLWYPMLIDLLIYEQKLRRSGVLEREFDPDIRG